MHPDSYFKTPNTIAQKQYEALRMFFLEKVPAKRVAERFGYTYRGFTTIVSEFRKKLADSPDEDVFFRERPKGRKVSKTTKQAEEHIVEMRKKYYSVEDIKVHLDAMGIILSERAIYNIIRKEGFGRLPRRSQRTKQQLEAPVIEAEKSCMLSFDRSEEFKSNAAGILCLLPYLKAYGIDQLIKASLYPETSTISRLNSILSFLALKTCNIRRYSADNLWCMDRGLGLFAGLNVLPKASWFSSYSYRVTAEMNIKFLKSLHALWLEKGLLGTTSNLDFTTIPYWGDDQHLENNWSGKRGRALSSMLAVLAHDPDTGIIDYGNTDVQHKQESQVVLEFLDFYRQEHHSPQYLVFDSKFTNYENLRILDQQNIKFITIRRRGKNIIREIEQTDPLLWKNIRAEGAGNKKRSLKILDQQIYLKGYNQSIRQITITGHGKIKPALIITNDFELPAQRIVRKYTRRWLVEKAIHEQIEFFHLNQLSSSIVVKVDFDLTISILAHNLYRIFALHMDRYQHHEDLTIFEKFIHNSAYLKVKPEHIEVHLEKKRTLPILLEQLNLLNNQKYPWLDDKKLSFSAASHS